MTPDPLRDRWPICEAARLSAVAPVANICQLVCCWGGGWGGAVELLHITVADPNGAGVVEGGGGVQTAM